MPVTWERRRLSELMPLLRRQLGPQGGDVADAVLGRGLYVALMRLAGGDARLYLWRTEPPKAHDWRAKWANEVAVLRKHFAVEHWRPHQVAYWPFGPLPTIHAAFDEVAR